MQSRFKLKSSNQLSSPKTWTNQVKAWTHWKSYLITPLFHQQYTRTFNNVVQYSFVGETVILDFTWERRSWSNGWIPYWQNLVQIYPL